MKICHLAVSKASNPSQPLDLVSLGGNNITNSTTTNGQYQNVSGLESNDNNVCVEATTTYTEISGPSGNGKLRHPAFVQANVDGVSDPASIRWINISTTNLDSLDGAHLFVEGHWVTTLNQTSNIYSNSGGTTLAVRYYPRRPMTLPVGRPLGGMNTLRDWSNLGNLTRNLMHVVDITSDHFDGDHLFNFDLPFQLVGVEFVGQDPNATVYIIGKSLLLVKYTSTTLVMIAYGYTPP